MGSFASLTKEASPRNSEKLVAEGTLSHSFRANLGCHKDYSPFQQTSDDFKETGKLITVKEI